MATKQHTCPYCDTPLAYRGLDAEARLVTVEWWCDTCKEYVYYDEPGLMKQDDNELTASGEG